MKQLVLLVMMGMMAAAAAVPDFMVVDLRAYKTVRFYEDKAKLPMGIDNAIYKTDYLIMRKIPKRDAYIALSDITSEQAKLVNAAAGMNILTALVERTGLDFKPPQTVVPNFEKGNPVLAAREVAALYAKKPRELPPSAPPLTWLTGKVGISINDALTADDAALAAVVKAKPDYVMASSKCIDKVMAVCKVANIPVMARVAMSGKFNEDAAAAVEPTVSAKAKQFGKSVFAWWFDGAQPENGFNERCGEILSRGAREGNPDALVTFNPGVRRLYKWCDKSDFTSGEVTAPLVYTCYGASVEGRQWHVLAALGAEAQPGCRYADEALRPWLNQIVATGGAVTLGVTASDAAQVTQAASLIRSVKNFKAKKLKDSKNDILLETAGRVLYVNAQKGNDDTGDGSRLRPFKTITAARNIVHRLVDDEKVPAGGIVVELTGRFDIPANEEVLDLFSSDSGPDENRRIVYTGSAQGALFTGAYTLTNSKFKPVSDAAVKARLPKEAADKVMEYDLKEFGISDLEPIADAFNTWAGFELFVNGKIQTIARYPNKGWLMIDRVIDSGIDESENIEGLNARARRAGSFTFKDPEHLKWNFTKGVWLNGYWTHDWASESLRVEKISEQGKRITLAGIHSYGLDAKKNGSRRYYAFNFIEALDVPGEYYIDRTAGKLYYYPVEGDLGEVCLAARTEPMMRMRDAKNVTVRNISFKWSQGSAVAVNGCNNVLIDGLNVDWMANSGITLNGGTSNTIANCTVAHLGTAGVSISGGDRKTLTPCANRITNCEVHHSGRLARSLGKCLNVGGCGVIVDHNYLHDAPYILMGYNGNDHIIEYNEVACAMMEGADGGGLYTGRDWSSQGNVIRYNYFHHFGSAGVEWEKERGIESDYEPVTSHVMVMGLYLDDCDCGDTVTNNVFHKAGWAMFVGGGRDNIVRNNVFCECTSALHLDTRGDNWKTINLKPGLPPGGNDGWNLLAKIEQFNYTEPPWSTRYPKLLTYLENNPKWPVGTEYVGNVAVNCKEFFQHSNLALDLVHRGLVGFKNNYCCPALKSDERVFPQNNREDKERVVIRSNRGLEVLSSNPGAMVMSPTFRKAFPHIEIPFDQIGVKKQ